MLFLWMKYNVFTLTCYLLREENKYYTKLMTILKLSSVDWNAFSRYYSPPAFSWFTYILFSYEMFLLHVLS